MLRTFHCEETASHFKTCFLQFRLFWGGGVLKPCTSLCHCQTGSSQFVSLQSFVTATTTHLSPAKTQALAAALLVRRRGAARKKRRCLHETPFVLLSFCLPSMASRFLVSIGWERIRHSAQQRELSSTRRKRSATLDEELTAAARPSGGANDPHIQASQIVMRYDLFRL